MRPCTYPEPEHLLMATRLAAVLLVLVLWAPYSGIMLEAGASEASDNASSDSGINVTRLLTLNATRDAYKDRYYPRWGYKETWFYGTSGTMVVGYWWYVSGYISNRHYYESLIYFNLTGIPPGATINHAILKLHYQGAQHTNDQDDVYRVYLAEQDWRETGARRYNDPNNTLVPPYNLQPPYVKFNVTGLNPGSWLTIDVTGLVQALVNGSHPNYGFALSFKGEELQGDGASMFSTREAGLPPQLVINYTAPSRAPSISLKGPPNGTVLAPSVKTVGINWSAYDPEGDALVYDLLIGNTPDLLEPVASNLTENSYNLTGLRPGETYYWKVRARDEYGATSTSIIYTFRVASLPDLVVAGVSTTPLPIHVGERLNVIISIANTGGYGTSRYGPFSVNITIDGHHCLYMDNATLGPGETMQLTCTGWSPPAPGEYTLSVRLDTGNVVPESNESNNDLTMEIRVPNRPPTLTLVTRNDTRVSSVNRSLTLEWSGDDPDGDPIIYNLYLGETPDPPLYAEGLTGTRAHVSLEPGKIYYWRVIASDGHGGMVESPVYRVVVDPPNRIRDTLAPGEVKRYQPLPGIELTARGMDRASFDVMVKSAGRPEDLGVPPLNVNLEQSQAYEVNGSLSGMPEIKLELSLPFSQAPKVYMYIPGDKGARASGWLDVTNTTSWSPTRRVLSLSLGQTAQTLGVSLDKLLRDPVLVVGIPPKPTRQSEAPLRPQVPPDVIAGQAETRRQAGLIIQTLGPDPLTQKAAEGQLADHDVNKDGKIDLGDAFAVMKKTGLISTTPPKLSSTTAQKMLKDLEKLYGTGLENYPTIDGRVYLLYMLEYLPQQD